MRTKPCKPLNCHNQEGCDWVTGNGNTNLWFAQSTLYKTGIHGCIMADIGVLKEEEIWVNELQECMEFFLKLLNRLFSIKTSHKLTLFIFSMSLTIECTIYVGDIRRTTVWRWNKWEIRSLEVKKHHLLFEYMIYNLDCTSKRPFKGLALVSFYCVNWVVPFYWEWCN